VHVFIKSYARLRCYSMHSLRYQYSCTVAESRFEGLVSVLCELKCLELERAQISDMGFDQGFM
jgi:hypothetical protein